MKIDYFLVHK